MVTDQARENVWRAARNLENVSILPANQLNAYEVLKAGTVLFMEEALEKFGPAGEKKAEKKETKAGETVKEKSAKTVSKPKAKKVVGKKKS